MIRRPPRSTLDRSSAASDVYKRQELVFDNTLARAGGQWNTYAEIAVRRVLTRDGTSSLSLIHISEPTRPY